MDIAFFEKPYRALLADIGRRADGVLCAMGAENAGLTAPLRKIGAQLARQGEELTGQGKLLQIGVMGQLKSGKSTFVNALLFEGKPVLPRGATPKTANLTIITYGEEDMLRVTFFSKEEWAQLTEAAERGAPSVALPARELLQMAKACGGGDDCIGYPPREIRFRDSAALERQLGQYVGEAGVLAPFVKSAELLLHNEALEGIAIVDTPGLNDRVYSRVRQTQAFMEKCDVVFYLSAAPDFMDTIDARLLFEQLPEQGVAKLVLIASKYDSALLDAVWDKGSLETADCDSRVRLGRQADAVVTRFVESTGSEKLADAVRACLPPLYVSSVVDSMVGRSYFRYTDEERRVYDGLACGGELTDDELRHIANFDAVRTLYADIIKKKMETLRAKGEQILLAANTLLGREVRRLDARLAGRARLLEGPDEEVIAGMRAAYERSAALLESGFARVFDGLRERLEEAADTARVSLETPEENAVPLRERRSVRSRERVEVVKASVWYLPWTWGKTKEKTIVEQQVYTYYAVGEAAERVKTYARECVNLAAAKLALAGDVDGVRRDLLSHALTVLGSTEAGMEPGHLRALTERVIEALAIETPAPEIDGPADEVAARFGKEADGAENMSELRDAVARVVSDIRAALADGIEEAVADVVGRLPALAEELRVGMTDALRAELTDSERRTADRDRYAASIADARAFLEWDGAPGEDALDTGNEA